MSTILQHQHRGEGSARTCHLRKDNHSENAGKQRQLMNKILTYRAKRSRSGVRHHESSPVRTEAMWYWEKFRAPPTQTRSCSNSRGSGLDENTVARAMRRSLRAQSVLNSRGAKYPGQRIHLSSRGCNTASNLRSMGAVAVRTSYVPFLG